MSSGFSSGFDGTLTPGPRRAVIAVDLMRAYFDDASPLCLPSSSCLDGAAAVLAAARAAGYPVFHTVVRFDDAAHGGVFLRKVPALQLLIRPAPDGGVPPLGELMPDVAPLEGETVLVKQSASAFFGTDLAALLHEAEVDTVIIIGVSTSGCVRATAVDAIQHDFVPIVVRDAVGDRDDAVQRATLYDLQAKYAEVVGLDELTW
ncbi:isochorismatase family protein [Arthrobacter bussei]|uniref:Isochorismatase family protein n=1 Tax=Arthrobacter bussei TaxID=2594179 RepID=A0A7X1NSM6_9MICC|nr:isochorismatase family protein [Arthrobacter bussei]MPY12080.1 isochorismatase family protein [Arthrobacter bussei]